MAVLGGLDILVTTEVRLAEQLAAAEAEARATGEAARLAIETEALGYAAELAVATEALAARSRERCQAEIAQIEAAADTVVRRFQGLPRERGEALASFVVDRVLAAWTGEAPS